MLPKPQDQSLIESDEHEHDCIPFEEIDLGGEVDYTPLDTVWGQRRGALLRWFEAPATWLDRVLDALVADKRFNPIYHMDTISVFLWLVVAATGVYLTFFYQFGFTASYEAIAKIESQPVAHIIRAIHRYASGAAMIATLVHGYRTFFMGRFKGPRWLAWVSGLVMVALLWLGGLSGYWMIWDVRAQWITRRFTEFLDRFSSWGTGLNRWMLNAPAEDGSWLFMFLLLAVHILLFLLIAFFYWKHVKRLKRPKFLPQTRWMVALTLLLIFAGLAFPLGMLAPADAAALPPAAGLDLIYLFYLPFASVSARTWLWGGLLGLGAALFALPWFPRAKSEPKVHIDKDLCTGCTKCAIDCPYNVITMVERDDDTVHKYIAIEEPDLCTSCGICVGSCDGHAVYLGDLRPNELWMSSAQPLAQGQAQSIVFACERHARSLQNPPEGRHVVPVPCAGALAPDLLETAIDQGAKEIRIAACPPEDCTGREGNFLLAERLSRQRVPRLKPAYMDAPIRLNWVTPGDVKSLFEGNSTPREIPTREASFDFRRFLPASLILALVLLVQVRFSDLSFSPSYVEEAAVQVAVDDLDNLYGPLLNPGGYLLELGRLPNQLRLNIDGETYLQQEIDLEALIAGQPQALFVELPLALGAHQLSLAIYSNGDAPLSLQLVDEEVQLQAGQIHILRP